MGGGRISLDFSFCTEDVKLHLITTMHSPGSSFTAHFGDRCLDSLDFLGDLQLQVDRLYVGRIHFLR